MDEKDKRIRQLEYECKYYRNALLIERKQQENSLNFKNQLMWSLESILEDVRDYISATDEKDLKEKDLVDIVWQDYYEMAEDKMNEEDE